MLSRWQERWRERTARVAVLLFPLQVALLLQTWKENIRAELKAGDEEAAEHPGRDPSERSQMTHSAAPPRPREEPRGHVAGGAICSFL